MKDVFDAKIMCENCEVKMEPIRLSKNNVVLRAVKCPSCGDKIVHPTDLENFKKYDSLRKKTYNVKLRVVGNSHAISIPKEVVDFINQTNKMEKKFNDVVRLCFEDFGRLSLNFFEQGEK